MLFSWNTMRVLGLDFRASLGLYRQGRAFGLVFYVG